MKLNNYETLQTLEPSVAKELPDLPKTGLPTDSSPHPTERNGLNQEGNEGRTRDCRREEGSLTPGERRGYDEHSGCIEE